MSHPLVSTLAAAGIAAMCGCDSPEVEDRLCTVCGLPNLVALVSFRPAVRVLTTQPAEIRRCDLWGCDHHHHALGRCRQHYDAQRRDLTPRDCCA